jgi:hypothetical protein
MCFRMDAAPATEQHLVSIPAWLQMPNIIDWAPPAPPPIIDIAAFMKAEQERISNIQNMVNAQLHAGDTRQALAEIRGAVEYPTTNNAANIHDASQDADSDDEKNDCCPPAVGLDDGPPMGVASIVTIMTAAADPFLDSAPPVIGMAGVEMLNRNVNPIADFMAARIDKASRVYYEQTLPSIATIGVVGLGAVYLISAAAAAASTRRKYL